MIIAISGMSGSGKNTVGEKVAKALRLRTVEYTFKDYARERGISLMEFQKLANQDSSIDRDFDRRLVANASRGNCVVTTWLGPWMVKKASLRVWLEAGERVRAKRISKREGMPAPKALAHLRKRDRDNIARYKKLYGINIQDRGVFDVIVNTEGFLPDEIAGIVVAAARCAAGK